MRMLALGLLLPGLALAGGSNYGVIPGARDIAGRITEWSVPTPRFARNPAPDGMLWVTYNGNGILAKVDPAAMKVVKEYAMPAGPRAGPYAVAVDAAGRVWANEIDTDTVALFDPKTEKFRVFTLPTSGAGIRKAIVDAEGRYWYMASHYGKP